MISRSCSLHSVIDRKSTVCLEGHYHQRVTLQWLENHFSEMTFSCIGTEWFLALITVLLHGFFITWMKHNHLDKFLHRFLLVDKIVVEQSEI